MVGNNVYKCIVSGACTPSVTSGNDTLTVNGLPAIGGSQPISQTICAGTNTSFSVSGVTGAGLSYQWYRNNGSGFQPLQDTGIISGSSTATLSINGAYASMNGYTYKVIVSGTCTPPVTSSIATLNVNTAPAIGGSQPANQTTCVGSSASFSVSGVTGAGLSYQWYRNSGSGFQPLQDTGIITGSTTASLHISGAYASMNGYTYRVIISGTCSPSLTSSSATLTVNTLPAIGGSQPINQTVCAGGNASFSVSGVSGTSVTYLWYRNNGSGFQPLQDTGIISGSTTATLQITGAYASMNGYTYRVIVSGACSPAVTSSTATLTVNTPPSIPVSGQPTNQTVCAGSNTSFSITGATGTGITYHWYRNNGSGFQPLQDTGIITGSTTATLHITGAYASMTGYTYECIVSGICTPSSVTSSIVTLTVNTLPSISGQPVSSTICAGNSTGFTTTATGTAITYTWYVNSGSGFSPVSNGGVYSGASTGNLAITAAPSTMNGYLYQCVINGTCTPPVTSNTVTLTVNTAPTLIAPLPPTSDTVCAGSNIAITANATGTSLSYQWYVNTGLGYTAISNGGVYSGVTNATLSITGALASMNHNFYQCIISGVCTPQVTTAPTLLNVYTLPTITSQPTSAPVCVGNDTSFSLTATGTNLVYVWLVNTGSGFTIVNNGGVYSGATTNTLHISSATLSMNGYKYECMVSGYCAPPVTSQMDTLTVNALPTITISANGPTMFCPNGTVTFTVSTGPGITGYQWQIGGVDIPNATGTSYTANPAGNYTCMVTNISGCTAVSNIIVVGHYTAPPANITSVGSTTICAGSSVVLNANTISNPAYQWQLNGTDITGATANTYTATVTGAYTVTVSSTNSNNCATTSSATYVVVNPLPPASVTPVGNPSFCNGGSILLVANTGANLSYQWMLNGSNINGATSSSYTSSVSGVFTVKVTDTACSAISSGILVTSNPYPSNTITTSTGYYAICSGSTLLLQASTTSGLSYQWSYNGVNINGAVASYYSTSNPGVYGVSITSAAGCSTTVSNLIVFADSTLNPVIYQTGNMLCTGSYPNIQWYMNGSPLLGETNQCYTPTQIGSYTVEVSDGLGCGQMSDVFTTTGVKTVSNPDDIRLYPNPATSVLHVNAPVKVNVSILNLQGQVVVHQDNANTIDISNLSNGVYMIQVYDAENILLKTERMVKNGL